MSFYFHIVPHLHPGTEQTPIYVCTCGAQAARRIRCRTHTPFPFRTLCTYHALCYHPHLTSRTFQPSPFRSKTKTKRRKKTWSRVINYLPCHLLIIYGDGLPKFPPTCWLTNCCHVLTRRLKICARRKNERIIIIPQLLHHNSQSPSAAPAWAGCRKGRLRWIFQKRRCQDSAKSFSDANYFFALLILWV